MSAAAEACPTSGRLRNLSRGKSAFTNHVFNQNKLKYHIDNEVKTPCLCIYFANFEPFPMCAFGTGMVKIVCFFGEKVDFF
jgi:hypothetical protein